MGIENCGIAHESTMWKFGAYHRGISSIYSRWLANSEIGYHQSFRIMDFAKELKIGGRHVSERCSQYPDAGTCRNGAPVLSACDSRENRRMHCRKNLGCDIETRQLGDTQRRSNDYSASQRMIRIRARSFRANAKMAPLFRATRYTLCLNCYASILCPV
jgi:hypothetical protein